MDNVKASKDVRIKIQVLTMDAAKAKTALLLEKHISALIENRKEDEGKIRLEVHQCVDDMLDASAEIIRIKNEKV